MFLVINTTYCCIMFVCLITDGVCLSGSSTEREKGGGCPAAGLLSAASSEGAYSHAATPPGASPHNTL